MWIYFAWPNVVYKFQSEEGVHMHPPALPLRIPMGLCHCSSILQHGISFMAKYVMCGTKFFAQLYLMSPPPHIFNVFLHLCTWKLYPLWWIWIDTCTLNRITISAIYSNCFKIECMTSKVTPYTMHVIYIVCTRSTYPAIISWNFSKGYVLFQDVTAVFCVFPLYVW